MFQDRFHPQAGMIFENACAPFVRRILEELQDTDGYHLPHSDGTDDIEYRSRKLICVHGFVLPSQVINVTSFG